jgi:hypothetical protein
VIADTLLLGYLDAVGQQGDAIARGEVDLRQGQFHDVLLCGEIAYRFPRGAESRRLLAGRVALLRTLATRELPVAIAQVVSDEALDQPLGRCHVALRRVPGHPIEAGALADPAAGSAAVDDLDRLLDRLAELGADDAVRASVDARRHAGDTPVIDDARAIAATFALQQALPAALSGDVAALDDGLLGYRDPR